MLAKGPSSRRTTKPLSASQQKAVDEKRRQGLLSCAECRRLKLRCDRLVPCGSCSRRGCASICPSGVLDPSAGHVHQGGMRLGQLRTKIGIMSGRIRELEAALEKGHPLLDDRLLKIGRIDEEPSEDPAVNQLDGLGTLTLSESGEASYFGSSGGNESLIAREMMLGSNSDEDDQWDAFNLNPTSELFTAVVGRVVSEEPTDLPPEDEARALTEVYLTNGAQIFFRAWTREDLLDEVLPKLYSDDGGSAHLRSALFFAFALGVYLNVKLTNGEHGVQAEKWFRRAQAAFNSQSTIPNSREDTIRALSLMGTYFSMATRQHSRDSAWASLALAAKLCQGVGLHRDPARWDLDPSLVQRRRLLFWEVYQSDISHSIALGRPPTTPLAYVDCEFPADNGDLDMDISTLKFQYARDAFLPVMDLILSTHPSKRPYREVIELDAKVRRLQIVKVQHGENPFKSFYSTHYINAVVLNLHRSYMARAILDGNKSAKNEKAFDPFDSTQTPFAFSVNAVYHAAEEISRDLYALVEKDPGYAGRVWFLTYHGFSAALVLGALASRAPGSPNTPKALMTLSLAVDGVFAKYAQHSPRHRTAFLILRRLRSRAVRQYTAFLEGRTGVGGHRSSQSAGAPGAGIGFGPGGVDANDPMFNLKPDSDPESDVESDHGPSNENKINLESAGGSISPGAGSLATFKGRIAMFGGRTSVLLSSKGKSKPKRPRTADNIGATSDSASPESTADTNSSSGQSPEAAASNTYLQESILGNMRPPSSADTSYKAPNTNNIDVFMSNMDIQQLGIDTNFDGMEGIEGLNVDAFDFGYDNFGTDHGSGIVMGMALEDIGMSSNNMGLGLSSSSAATNSTTYGGGGINRFNVYHGFPPQSSPSLSPDASSPTLQQKQELGSESLTATAQAALMYPGLFPSGTDMTTNSSKELLRMFAMMQGQRQTQTESQSSSYQQQQLAPSIFSASSSSPTTSSYSHSPSPASLLASTPSPIRTTSTSPTASIEDSAQLYARFTEFLAMKGLVDSPPQQQNQQQMPMNLTNQITQQQYNSYTNDYSVGNQANMYSAAQPKAVAGKTELEYDSDIESFLRMLQGPAQDNAETAGMAGGAGYMLPYDQIYGQWQNPNSNPNSNQSAS